MSKTSTSSMTISGLMLSEHSSVSSVGTFLFKPDHDEAYVGIVSLNLSKAFDRVCHYSLITKRPVVLAYGPAIG